MLSIARIRDGNYYLDLAREDYYLEGGEPPGEWFGAGALVLGLSGKVARAPMQLLLAGLSPDGTPLVQNAGSKRHRAGWDLTFSVPKTVSVLWSQADDETRRIIEACHRAAVRETLAYLERVAAWTRRGKGGQQRERVGLVVATFEHGTSRAQDPLLHTHCLVFNVGTREDGTSGTILSTPLFRHKMVAGALYRIALGNQLVRRLGLKLKRVANWFELSRMPKRVVKFFSKRRQEVVDELQARGRKSAKAAAIAALDSRKWKEHRPRGDLLDGWRAAGREHGFSTAEVTRLLGRNRGQPFAGNLDEIIAAAIEALTAQHSHFAKRFVLRTVAQALQGENISLQEITDAVDRFLYTSPEIVALSHLDGEARFTSTALFEREATLLATVRAMQETTRHGVREATLTRVLKAHPRLKQEQSAAVKYILSAPGSIKAVKGLPGTGKTTHVLAACREAWEREGYRVLGLAVAGKAARGLQEDSGINSETFAKLYYDSQKGLLDRLNHDRLQIGRAMYKLPTYRYEKLRLNPKTVLVVDEAGMVDTPAMAWLIEEVNKHGCTLVLIGDPNQLPPIGVGGPFTSIAKTVGAVELTDMQRQRDPCDIAALKQLAAGEVEKAVQSYAQRGLIQVAPDRRAAVDQLVHAWQTHGGLDQPQNHAIIVTTNSDRTLLNQRCQLARISAGRVQPDRGFTFGHERICVGEPVVFLEGNRRLDVENGDRGVVIGASKLDREIKVFLERGKVVTVPVADYQQLTLGYALTTHKLQGATVPGNAYVLWGESRQEREMAFTQLSRAKETTRIYLDQAQAGNGLSGLVNDLKTSVAKDLAHDQRSHTVHPIPLPNLDGFLRATPPEHFGPPPDWDNLQLPTRECAPPCFSSTEQPLLPVPHVHSDTSPARWHESKSPPPATRNFEPGSSPEPHLPDSTLTRTPAIASNSPPRNPPPYATTDEPHVPQSALADRPTVVIPDFHLSREATRGQPQTAVASGPQPVITSASPHSPSQVSRADQPHLPQPVLAERPRVVIPDFHLSRETTPDQPPTAVESMPRTVPVPVSHSGDVGSDIQAAGPFAAGDEIIAAELPTPTVDPSERPLPGLESQSVQRSAKPQLGPSLDLATSLPRVEESEDSPTVDKDALTKERGEDRRHHLQVQIEVPYSIDPPRHERSR